MAFLRVVLLLLVVLVGLYLVLRVTLSLRERSRLAREWEDGALGGTREDHVQAGMDLYVHSLRRRLLWGVVVVPMAALVLLLYLLNIN